MAAAGRPELAPSSELGSQVSALAGRIGIEPLTHMAHLLERIHDGLWENAAPRLSLEAAMLSWPIIASRRD